MSDSHMLYTKMRDIIDEVNDEVAEREELIECIAICPIASSAEETTLTARI